MNTKLFLDRLEDAVKDIGVPAVLCIDIETENDESASFVVINEPARKLTPMRKSSIFHCMAGLLSENLAEFAHDDRP